MAGCGPAFDAVGVGGGGVGHGFSCGRRRWVTPLSVAFPFVLSPSSGVAPESAVRVAVRHCSRRQSFRAPERSAGVGAAKSCRTPQGAGRSDSGVCGRECRRIGMRRMCRKNNVSSFLHGAQRSSACGVGRIAGPPGAATRREVGCAVLRSGYAAFVGGVEVVGAGARGGAAVGFGGRGDRGGCSGGADSADRAAGHRCGVAAGRDRAVGPLSLRVRGEWCGW